MANSESVSFETWPELGDQQTGTILAIALPSLVALLVLIAVVIYR